MPFALLVTSALAGTFWVHVEDGLGRPVTGAHVRTYSEDGTVGTAGTNRSGWAEVSGIPAGCETTLRVRAGSRLTRTTSLCSAKNAVHVHEVVVTSRIPREAWLDEQEDRARPDPPDAIELEDGPGQTERSERRLPVDLIVVDPASHITPRRWRGLTIALADTPRPIGLNVQLAIGPTVGPASRWVRLPRELAEPAEPADPVSLCTALESPTLRRPAAHRVVAVVASGETIDDRCQARLQEAVDAGTVFVGIDTLATRDDPTVYAMVAASGGSRFQAGADTDILQGVASAVRRTLPTFPFSDE